MVGSFQRWERMWGYTGRRWSEREYGYRGAGGWNGLTWIGSCYKGGRDCGTKAAGKTRSRRLLEW